MQINTIAKLLNYYYTTPRFLPEIERAWQEFWRETDPSVIENSRSAPTGPENMEQITTDPLEQEEIQGLFNEWLVFDFHLGNGKTLLEDFYERDPHNLPMWDRQVYKDLAQTNEYGLFEVLKVDLGQGLELINLNNNKKYQVREKMATYDLQPGYLFFTRVGLVGDHYELVGSSPAPVFDNLTIAEGMKKYLRKLKGGFSPQTTVALILGPANMEDGDNDENKEELVLSLEEAENELDLFLKRFGLDKFIEAKQIKKWVSQVKWNEEDVIPVCIGAMLLGLSDGRILGQEDAFENLLWIINNIYSHTPQKALGGKTPAEKEKERQEKQKPRQLTFNNFEIGNPQWHKWQAKAARQMADAKSDKAQEYFNKAFKKLLADRTTSSQIYRLFANHGLNHFYLGNEFMGRSFLEIALELNPNYDFAFDAMRAYEKGEFDEFIFMGRFKNLAKSFKSNKRGQPAGEKTKLLQDPAYIYYKFLKQFKINFKTKEKTVFDVTKVGPDGKIKTIKSKRKAG